jgi:hypothetical protein
VIRVRAVNFVGFTPFYENKNYLKVASKPTGRVEPQYEFPDFETIRIVWEPMLSPENGGEINTTYKVYYAEGKYDAQWSLLCNSAISFCDAKTDKHGIIPLRTYKFKVIAFNALG